MRTNVLVLSLLLLWSCSLQAQLVDPPTTNGDRLLADYFRQETNAIAENTFAEIETLEDWTSRRKDYRRQLLQMLGLDPMPERTPLEPVITGSVEKDGVVAERLQFQSSPGLYVTGNLYRPVDQQEPLPAILYVCGHGKEMVDGVSVGNKTHYQHHGAWFARNGYVCLMIDTIQLGEIEGIHHGTYREGMWWWNNRGYTPAGVEAWNCIRALDYLQSREEVDGERIGVTGRSGGGAYSYWIAAIDERIQVAVPVAGITSLKNHVVDGCVEGHCDCMYMLNSHRWDFPMVAALIAPRPLLIANSDKDRIFPLDGVVDVYAKTRQIYSLYDAKANLGLYITEGPHRDTQELRIGAFRWMNRFLKDEDALIEMAAKPLFERQELKVFETLPEDQRVTTIHESFVPMAISDATSAGASIDEDDLIRKLQEQTFGGWPQEPESMAAEWTSVGQGSIEASTVEFTSQTPYRLTMYLLRRSDHQDSQLDVIVLNSQQYSDQAPLLAAFFPDQFPDIEPDETLAKKWKENSGAKATAFVLPRGVGPTEWTSDERERVHIRRRFMLIGQTQAAMQIYDVRRALEALREMPEWKQKPIHLVAEGEAAVWSLYASLFVDPIASLELTDLPESNRDAPDLLNVSRVAELSDVKKLAEMRTK